VIQAREDETPFTSLDLSTVVPGKEREVIEEKTSGFQRSLDLHKGPVVRVVYFYLGNERPARLLFVVHHLVIDGVSWRILLEDFAATYEFLSQGKPAAMQPKTTSFKEWSERLREYATSGLLKDETRYWGTLHRMRWKSAPLPVDFPDGENTYGSTKRIVVTFSNEETRALIHDVPKILHAQVNDILLTALARACYRWTGKTALLLDLEGHGREQLWEDIDLSRTIGWFTSLFPIMLDIGRHGHWKDALLLVQNQLRRLPGNGLGFGVIRFLSPDQKLAEKIRDIPQPGMSFNYLGQFDGLVPQDSMFRLAPELPGPERAPGGRRANMLDFMARVIEGKLEVVLEYSRNLHRDDTMSSLVQNFMDEIRLMLGEVSSVRVPDAAGPDIEMVGLSAQELEIVLDEAKGTPHHAREHRKRGY
jgi:non-ribosomal peptide synthase protein (TIGR01720 family)